VIIDIHVHTAEYSPCSNIDLEEAILKAQIIGLDGICITDHESNGIFDKANELSKKHNFLVIVWSNYFSGFARLKIGYRGNV